MRANGFGRDAPPTEMTRRYGVWLGRRSEAFALASDRYFKRLAEKQKQR